MHAILLCCAFLLLGLGIAGADPLQSTHPAAVLRDPSPQDRHDFSLTAANPCACPRRRRHRARNRRSR